MKGFLYGQTEYNLLNNSIHLDDYIKTAVANSFSFLSITDRNLYAAYKFYTECKKNKLKPVIGLEICYIDDDNYKSFILAYAKNEEGYKNLLKISTYLSTNEIPKGLDFIKEYTDGIAFVVVYNESMVERLFVSKAYDEVAKKIEELQMLGDLYIGYSYTNRLDRLKSNYEINEYCVKKGINTLPLHNCRYLKPEDSIIYETLTKISGTPFTIKEYHDYSFDMNPVYSKELENFVNSISLNIYEQKALMPKYHNTKGACSKDYLASLCNKGLFKRLKGKIPAFYQQRLNYELDVINKMGFDDYFLIVWDFILYAKKNNILVGPGRGSAAGSLVAYCLGITEIDPLKYDLLFERFLNPERLSMPDIDTDFPDNHRDDVIKYVNDFYGPKHVCNISAFNTFSLKSSIRDIGRILKIDNSRLEEIVKLVETSNDFDKLLSKFSQRPEIYNILYIVRGLDGLPRHISTHAAGIIISSSVLDDVIPLQNGLNGLYQSQFEADDLQNIGLLKMDFLGIRNLTIVDEVIKLIPGFTIDKLRNIPLNDKKTFELLQRADTLGVFQLESDGIRKVLSNLKPEKFDDLVAVLALYRPGPMDNIDEFIARRHGKKFSYLHPILEPILKSTYGIIVYQEQIMMIAQSFAGFSLGEADLLRRAVSKKKQDELMSLEKEFISRSISKGFSETIAKQIYEYILKFANYGFNKSHSVAYGILAYQMAYLKANYFSIFISKILNNVIGSIDTMVEYIEYAKKNNVKTMLPHINISSTVFEVRDATLYIPLQAIHSIGEANALEIVRERESNGLFKDFEDFRRRMKLNSNIFEALIYSGALDCFGFSRKRMVTERDQKNEVFAKYLEGKIDDNSEFDFSVLQQKELEYLGFNYKYNIFVNIESLYYKYNAKPLKFKYGRAIVCFKQIKKIKTKNNEDMLLGIIADKEDIIDFVIFPNVYQTLNIRIDYKNLYIINYQIKKNKDNKDNVVINNIETV